MEYEIQTYEKFEHSAEDKANILKQKIIDLIHDSGFDFINYSFNYQSRSGKIFGSPKGVLNISLFIN